MTARLERCGGLLLDTALARPMAHVRGRSIRAAIECRLMTSATSWRLCCRWYHAGSGSRGSSATG